MKTITNSMVQLSNGQEVHCNNTVDEINKELQEKGCIELFLSKQQGKELFVTKHQVVHCVPFD